ncbi:MAG: hypothetical protein DMG22_09250 [Acidobacteria bacterium]|nr:MAG: hypothetical protein DMG22_09250 [Acidobacteriota bacterium]
MERRGSIAPSELQRIYAAFPVAGGIRPHPKGRAQISAYGSYLGNVAARSWAAHRTPHNPTDMRASLCLGFVLGG